MKKSFVTTGIAAILIMVVAFFTACSTPVEVVARDGIAAAKGYIESEQAKHHDECTSDPVAAPKMHTCVVINQAVAAQNLAIDALETYCASADFTDNKGPCKPDKSLEPKLRSAMENLQNILQQVQAFTGDKAPTSAAVVKTSGIGGLAPLGSVLGLIQLALGILSSVLAGLSANPKYSGIVTGVQAAITELQKVHDEVVTKEELESLRTTPRW
jgi:hypothetical protein